MRYLTRQTGGNIHDNGTIEITSNSINDSSCHPKNLVNYENDSRYQSLMGSDGNTFIRFDFKDRNWVIEISDDGENWEEIDRHIDDPALNGQNIVHNFKVNKKNSGFHRFVRLRQTGKTWSQPGDPYHFFFSFIEFYGKLRISQNKKFNTDQ